MNKLENIYQKSIQSIDYVDSYLVHLKEIIDKIERSEIAKVIELFTQAKESGNTIFFIGNGGSAATASHFANDIAIGTRTKKKNFRVISLTDNNSVITAIGNDFGYDDIFKKQLENIFCEGDILVGISASGNSVNVLNAMAYAKKNNGVTIGLTGFDGGQLLNCVDYSIHVPTEKGEYGPVEDLHMIFDHIIGTYLMYANRERE